MNRTIKKNKKLKINDINKNTSKEVAHSINKIKANERKYTIILVIFFMILFMLIGYFTLRVDNNNLTDNVSSIQSDIVLSSSKKVTLTTSDNIKDNYLVKIKNNSSETINYKLILVTDDTAVNSCGCTNRPLAYEYIKYSINKENISYIKTNSNNEIVITTGSLKSGKLEKLKIDIWIDENIDTDIDYHFHGYFKIERVEDINT